MEFTQEGGWVYIWAMESWVGCGQTVWCPGEEEGVASNWEQKGIAYTKGGKINVHMGDISLKSIKEPQDSK